LREDGLATASATHHGGKLCLARLALPETLIEEWIFGAHRDTAACIQRCDYCMELQRYDLSDKRQRFRLNRRAVHVYEKPISILHEYTRFVVAIALLSSCRPKTRRRGVRSTSASVLRVCTGIRRASARAGTRGS
jgi:hypothetical protein